MIKKNQFYHKYANLPLAKRGIVLDMINHGHLTLQQIYHEMKTHDEAIRAEELAQEKLLLIAEGAFYNLL